MPFIIGPFTPMVGKEKIKPQTKFKILKKSFWRIWRNKYHYAKDVLKRFNLNEHHIISSTDPKDINYILKK